MSINYCWCSYISCVIANTISYIRTIIMWICSISWLFKITGSKGALNKEIDTTINTILLLEKNMNKVDETNQSKQQMHALIESLYVVLRYKMIYQTNLVRAIKNPFDKYFNQIALLKNRQQFLKAQNPSGDQNCMATRILNDVTCCRKAMQNTLTRDYPWVFINVPLVSLSFMVPVVAILGFQVTLLFC